MLLCNFTFVVLLLLFFTNFDSSSAKSVKVKATKSKPRSVSGCTINLKSDVHKDRPPMIIRMSSNLSYHYPSTVDLVNLEISANDLIGIFCPGKSNRDSSAVTEPAVILLKNSTLTEAQQVEPIACKSGKSFKVAGKTTDFADINCEEKSHMSYNAILRLHSENPSCVNGDRYEIGYEMGNNGYLRTIELCHNKDEAKTLWAHAIIEPANQDKNRYTGDRHSFKTGLLYENMHMSTNDPYSLNSVYKTVDSILDTKGAVDQYLSNKTSERKFLARGHLIASADKLYKSEQDSTMFYANVVPMWQQVNANPGNWFFVEEYVRHLAFQKGRQLDAWAGGVGLLKLEGKEIHLYRQGSGTSLELRIPVPKVIFKCVVDKAAREALCFLVANNPYAKASEVGKSKAEYRVCRKLDACDNLTTNFDDPAKGYLYCCELKDFYTKNRKKLGLEDLKAYVGYKKMEILTNDKLHEAIPWSKKDEKRSGSKKKSVHKQVYE